MLKIREFINKVNSSQVQKEEYKFYMIVDEEKYEITPIYNSMGYLDEIALDDCENIISAFSMTEIINADYLIKKVKE